MNHWFSSDQPPRRPSRRRQRRRAEVSSLGDLRDDGILDYTTLFVRFINYGPSREITYRSLKSHFEEFHDKITRVIVPPHRDFGIIHFKSEDEAADALEAYNGSMITERCKLKISFSKKKGHTQPEKTKGKEKAIAEEIIEEKSLKEMCSASIALYLKGKFHSTEFKTLASTLPARIFLKGGNLYLSGTRADIQTATQVILHSPLVSGLYIELITVDARPSMVYGKTKGMMYELAIHCIEGFPEKCDVLLYSKNFTKFQEAKKSIQSLKATQKSCQLPHQALPLSHLSKSIETEFSVAIKQCSGSKVMVHGLCSSDVEKACSAIQKYIKDDEIVEKKVQMAGFRALFYSKEYTELAENHSCHIKLPTDKLNHKFTIIITGSKPKVDIVAEKIEHMFRSTDKIEFKDEAVGLVLMSSAYVKKVEKKATEERVLVSKLPTPQLGFRLTGEPKPLYSVKCYVLEYQQHVEKSEVGCHQVILGSHYQPLCSSKEFEDCIQSVKDEQGVCTTISTEVACYAQRHLLVNGHAVTIRVVVGELSKQKACCAIVVPTDRATQDRSLYPIVPSYLAVQSFQDGQVKKSLLNNSSRNLVEVGEVACLDGGKLKCLYVFHTIFPAYMVYTPDIISNQAMIRNSLALAVQKKVNSLAYPGIKSQMVQCLLESLYSMKVECLHTVSLVVRSEQEAKLFKEALSSAVSSSQKKPIAKASDFLWLWKDDSGSFVPYMEADMVKINDAYQRDPHGMCHLTIKQFLYDINFTTMKQVNQKIGTQRDIRREVRAEEGLMWKYREKDGYFYPYLQLDSIKIEKMYQLNDTYSHITILKRQYHFNFNDMKQINVMTGNQRDIKRLKGQGTAEFLHSSDVVLNMKGPSRNIKMATDEIQESLTKLLHVNEIPLFMPSLQEKMIALAKSHNVGCSVKENSASLTSQQVSLRVEGQEELVQKASAKINEALVKATVELSDPNHQYPSTWEAMPEDEFVKIVPLKYGGKEFTDVSKQFKETMPYNSILKVELVQNKFLWDRYASTMKRMHKKNAGQVNEKLLFHGPRTIPAKKLCSSEEGFDMRHSREGMWGKANYFAEKASYSDTYAYHNTDAYNEMILAKVLTGDSHYCAPDKSLKFPPEKPSSSGLEQTRYDSVQGITKGTTVFMTYSNELAYPTYIITYSCFDSTTKPVLPPKPSSSLSHGAPSSQVTPSYLTKLLALRQLH